MNGQEKYKIAFRMTSRAFAGLSFVEDYLMEHPSTDPAYLRSLYILLSYSAELILKSRVVMKNNFLNKNEIDKRLKNLLHDIEKIGKDIGSIELLKLGINAITKIGGRYIVTTTNSEEIYIEDFADIRYSFIDGKIRTVDTQEHERIKGYIGKLMFVLQKTKMENEKLNSQDSAPR